MTSNITIAMCDFTDYGIADKIRMRKKIGELENIQEEREEHIIVTQ